MLRSSLVLTFAVVALTFPGASRAAVTVFQDPTNLGTPAGSPATVVAGGANVTLNVFYQTGTVASPGCPGVPPTCNRCLSGTGDEVCGWDIHISATNPAITLVSFTPDAGPGSDIVWAISGNVLRANGGIPTTGELGIHRIGALVVSAAPAASGSVTVAGNLYASAALAAVPVTTGNLLATVGTNPDSDLDGVPDSTDNCPTIANADQADGNGGLEVPADGVGNLCDNCLNANNPRVISTFLTTNAWATLTGGQRDDDHDGFGNKCDGDFTATGALTNTGDLAQWRTSNGKARSSLTACGSPAGQRCARYDMDESGALINSADLAAWRLENGGAAGPKCATCPLACTSGSSVTCASPP